MKIDSFKIYIDYEDGLDLVDFTNILKSLELISYEVCIANNIDYDEYQLKIKNIYPGSIWIVIQEYISQYVSNPTNLDSIISSTLVSFGFLLPQLKKNRKEKKEIQKEKKENKKSEVLENEGISEIKLLIENNEFVKQINNIISILDEHEYIGTLNQEDLYFLKSNLSILDIRFVRTDTSTRILTKILDGLTFLETFKNKVQVAELFNEDFISKISILKNWMIKIIREKESKIVKEIKPKLDPMSVSEAINVLGKVEMVPINFSSDGSRSFVDPKNSIRNAVTYLFEMILNNKDIKKFYFYWEDKNGKQYKLDIKDDDEPEKSA